MDREALIKRRDELKKRLAAIEKDIGGGLEKDLEDQAQQLENYDTLMEIARVAEKELADVNRQLVELED